MVIDDDTMNTQLFGEIGELTGWSVLTAEDGESGLGKAREQRPDVILLDLMMPRLDGFAVLSKLQRDPRLRKIPVMVVTAIDETGSSDRAMSLGAMSYIRKPFSVLDLKDRIGRALQFSREARKDEGGASAEKEGDLEMDMDMELVRFIDSQTRRYAQAVDRSYGLIMVGLSRDGEPSEKEDDWEWLAESVLMVMRRPQWLFRLSRGQVAVYLTGLDATAMGQTAHNLQDALDKGLRRSEALKRPEAHVVCCPGLAFEEGQGEVAVSHARSVLDEALRSGKSVDIVS